MDDSGERQVFETGAQRDTGRGKPRIDLISPYAALREGEWLREGAEKYAERNWEQGIPISRCVASLERHLADYKRGDRSEDHMAAVRTNAGFILHFEELVARGLLPVALMDLPWYEASGNCPRSEPELETDNRYWGLRFRGDEEWIHYHAGDDLDNRHMYNEHPTHLGPSRSADYEYEQLWDTREKARVAQDLQDWAVSVVEVARWDGDPPIPFEEVYRT